jgi:hypothetical protein
VADLPRLRGELRVDRRILAGALRHRDDDVGAVTAKVEPSLLLYLGAIGIGLLVPRVAVVPYLAIAMYVMIPFRAIARWLRRGGDP